MKKEKIERIGPDENGRYYYKAKSGKGFMNLKSPLDDENYVEITKEEFDTLTHHEPHVPTPEEIAAKEKAAEIASLKKQLADTDYIVIKIAEALADGNDALVSELKETYSTELANRISWRARINELEA